MNFRLRMALVFTLLVGVLILLFGFLVLRRAEKLREAEFFERLEERAGLVEQLLLDSRELPLYEAEHLRQMLIHALPNGALLVIGTDGSTLFAHAAEGVDLPESWRELATRRGVFRLSRADRQYVVIDRPETRSAGIQYTLASAVDVQGLRSLSLLRRWMLGAALLALAFTAFLSWWYATWAMAPVRELVHQVGGMKDPSERLPVPENAQRDELGEMTVAFNGLLTRLDDAFQVQRSFIATASHELRTPLTVVRGELHQAMLELKDDPGAMRHLLVVEEQAVHMQDLLTQLLWLARTQEGTSTLLNERVRMDDVAERAMERCRMRYPEIPVRFELDLRDDVEPVVMGNTVLLTAAVYNLLSNAAKYGGGGPVELRIQTTGGQLTCIVSDRGPGMDEATLAHALELFYRAVDAPATDGHGIGLTLVDRVARVHGGSVTMASKPGRGTRVELSIPTAR